MKLWIDDDALTPGMEHFRYPPDDSWHIVTSVKEAKEFVKLYGFPEELGIDHDLGEESVMSFLYWLEERYPDACAPKWSIHSMNPVGAENVKSFMLSWERSRTL